MENSHSELRKIQDCGVPQGSILGPLLYIVFIIDIKNIDEVIKIIYADDTNAVVFAETTRDLAEKTNRAMMNMTKYYSSIELKLNPGKTELINHNAKIVQTEVVVNHITGEVKKSTNEAKMLGIFIDSELNFKRHIDSVVRDVEHNLILFRKVAKHANLDARKALGQGVLISRIMYGLQAVAGTTEQQLSRLRVLYNKCTMAMMHCSKKQRIKLSDQRSELNLLSFDNLVRYLDVTMLYKIVKSKTPESLSEHIVWSSRDSRPQNRGKLTVNFIAKTEKMSKSFLFRAVRTINQLPRSIRVKIPNITQESFKSRVREYYMNLNN